MLNIAAILVIAAMLVGLAMLSMPVPKQASAQYKQKLPPGSTVAKCEFSGSGFAEKCITVVTPNLH